jgi:hypothetical protein
MAKPKQSGSPRFATSDSWSILFEESLTGTGDSGALVIERLSGRKKGKLLRIKAPKGFRIVPHVESQNVFKGQKYFTSFCLVDVDAKVKVPDKP